jgi:hypothetical protein
MSTGEGAGESGGLQDGVTCYRSALGYRHGLMATSNRAANGIANGAKDYGDLAIEVRYLRGSAAEQLIS